MRSDLPDDLLAYRRHVANQIRDLRKAAGLTQQELADRASLEKQAVSQIENAHVSPRLDTLWNLARAMDVGVDKLVHE
ncbi:helix-turn-helix domain-containing protein [Streptomyces fimicarius]|uniref:helix-turn-helix domain-containing protein n=1 Tax=Streptomyces griseus TaxID=1911 RepID=UPI0035DD970C